VPDVITLDIEMPRNGWSDVFLEKLMAQHPIPVVICSTLTRSRFADRALAALEERRR